jgi:LAO/AO transport system kinase
MTSAALLAEFRARRPAALARAISIVENRRPGFEAILAALYPSTGRARRIGVTGPPGAGKSTLTAQLTSAWRAAGHTVGIVAVDPTSPYTGGALLGDRIRMEAVALDDGVYIRSLATRGAGGGMSAAAADAADVLDAFGFDRVIIETVGVGQSELDVAQATDSCLLVLVPESGDAIQALKAGLMEVADLFVVNKADRPGADQIRRDIEFTLRLRAAPAAAVPRAPAPWTPPVLATAAVTGTGIADVLGALDAHYAYLFETGSLAERRRARLQARVVDIVDRRMRERMWEDAAATTWLAGQLDALAARETTPFAVADALLARPGGLGRRTP